MGVLTGRLPLLLHSAGSTGALRHPNPPVTSEDREDGGSGGGRGGVKWSHRKFLSWDQSVEKPKKSLVSEVGSTYSQQISPNWGHDAK